MIGAGSLIAIALLSMSSATRLPHHNARHGVREADRHGLCSTTYYSIEEYAGKPQVWMEFKEAEQQVTYLAAQSFPYVQITVDGIPCVEHGCCQHTILVRPRDSDLLVASLAIQEYATALSKLKDWKPTTILDGGGNIGMASVVFAFLYPEAEIIAIEPEKQNCLMAKYNTATFPFVHVQCDGLWSRETTVALQHGRDDKSWGWEVVETTANTPGSSKTATVQSLLEQHGLTGFDYAKLDIEGAEYNVFGENADKSWINSTSLLSIEIHGDRAPIDAVMSEYGMLGSNFGEYVFYAKPHLHTLLTAA